MKLAGWWLASSLLGLSFWGPRALNCSASPTAPAAALSQGREASRPSRTEPTSTAAQYTLSPERRAKARSYSEIHYILYFAGVSLLLATNFLLWRARATVLFRDWARRATTRHFAQCLVFAPLFLGAVSLAQFPMDYYAGFTVEHRFGLSNQGFISWLGDWGKNFAISTLLGVVLVWIFYSVVRRSPRGWWFYFWLISIPLALSLILVEPYVIAPLFYKFSPLEKTAPALTDRIEAMMAHAGLSIPRSRIFEMNASAKTNTVDAYVSGLGASKRVVVWDTTLRKTGGDETLLILGHEAGHYTLHHIPKEFALIELICLFLSLAGFVAVNRILKRWGGATSVEGVGDLASLPVVVLVFTVLVFLASPLINGISRHYEHQADQFGLEVAYGVVADPNDAEVRALQVLGEEDLADPDPNPLIEFWIYDHPPLKERIQFAVTYQPWAQGQPMELLPARQP